MLQTRQPTIIILIFLALILGACNFPSRGQPSPTQPNLVYTAAAMTVQAQLTQAAVGTQMVLPTWTAGAQQPTATGPATNTPVPSNTAPPQPTATQAPPTPVPVPCDRASFVADITYPDNTEVIAGTTFVKTWRLKNTGSCTWTSAYALVFESGDAMSGPAAAQLTSGTVPAGGTIDVSVTLKAPDSPGTYRGNWKLRNAAGLVFGIGEYADKPFWVQIKAVSAVPTSTVTPTPTATPQVFVGYDFISKGPDAQWRNATTVLPWGDPQDDAQGVAVDLSSAKLEDNKTYNRLLATYPQRINDGIISGLYPSYIIQNGDHFRVQLGFKADCTNGKVRYQLKYLEGNIETMLGEWVETCDGNLLNLDINLSNLAGKSLQFILIVKAEGSPDSDKSVWVNPRIER